MPLPYERYFLDTTGVGLKPHTSHNNIVLPLIDAQHYFHQLRNDIDDLLGKKKEKAFFYISGWLGTWDGVTGGRKLVLEQPSEAELLLTTPDIKATLGAPKKTAELPARTTFVHQMAPEDAAAAFVVDDIASKKYKPLVDELILLHQNGVDVRVLLWMSPFILRFADGDPGSLRWNNVYNALSISTLRAKSGGGLHRRAALFTIAHPIGALHTKIVVCGDGDSQRAYVGGIDLAAWRLDTQQHLKGSTFHWHDVAAKITGGAAVRGVYDCFRELWGELHSRESLDVYIDGKTITSHQKNADPVPEWPFTASNSVTGSVSVQVLRTYPAMNIVKDPSVETPKSKVLGGIDHPPTGMDDGHTPSQRRLVSGVLISPWKIAPKGIFEFALALEKAISAAQKYIYAEDQGFYAWEIMEWLRKRIAAVPGLKVILVQRADPKDGSGVFDRTATAINQHLLFPPLSSGRDIKDQFAFFARKDAVTIHAKTWLIDDELMIVGSPNAFRRSLYTDVELALSIFDDSPSDKGGNVVVSYRSSLWAEHCGIVDEPSTIADRAKFRDLGAAIAVWIKDWAIAPAKSAAKPLAGVKLLPVYERASLPMPMKTAVTAAQRDFFDADSRDSM